MAQIKLGDLAALVGGELVGDAAVLVHGAATIPEAQEGDITFAENDRALRALAGRHVAAVVVPRSVSLNGVPGVVVADVHLAFAQIIAHFRPSTPARGRGISLQASVAPTARVGSDVEIQAFVSIGDDVEIGDRVVIHAGVRILPGCRLADDVILYPNVVLYERTEIGARSIIHAGTVIGAYGFGYQTKGGRHVRSAQLGNVRIGEDVEIGAGTTIDRGTYDATVIGDGTKIDNQVMIAHNVHIGRHNLLCSQVGIAGSCTTGDYVVMAGQVGLSDHLTIGDRAVLGAKAGVMCDLEGGHVYIGAPVMKEREYWRRWVLLGKLPEMQRMLKRLEQWMQESAERGSGPPRRDAA